jgi:hypothetical protein
MGKAGWNAFISEFEDQYVNWNTGHTHLQCNRHMNEWSRCMQETRVQNKTSSLDANGLFGLLLIF